MQILYAALIGLFGGTLGGLFGVGGGIIMVPAMVLAMGVPPKTAIGTSLMVIVPTALIAGLKHYQQGNVDWRVGLSLAPMALVGGILGAYLTTHIPADSLKKMFGVLLVVVGAKMFMGK